MKQSQELTAVRKPSAGGAYRGQKLEERWNSFLETLDPEEEFDKDLKMYLEALRDVSDITKETIEGEGAADIICEKLKTITVFIEKYKDTYYEIGRIKGFRAEEPEGLRGRDYYNYIADQKMKAAVYRARYLNFMEEAFREQRDPVYIKYMLFHNLLREIRYMGAAYQYLWHWEQKRETLYRCNISTKERGEKTGVPKTRQEFFETMFSDVVSHMNAPGPALRSYSENPFLDIYKYLLLREETGGSWEKQNTNPHLVIRSRFFENKTSVTFEIVKEAYVNTIFAPERSEPCTFDAYAQAAWAENTWNLAYTVEVFPQKLRGEKNEKGTIKRMKNDYFPQYLSSWDTSGRSWQLSRTTVADDKEVIAYGPFYKRTVELNNENVGEPFESYEAGTRFRMELTKEDVIYLLLKTGERFRKQEPENRSAAGDMAERMAASLELCHGWKDQLERAYSEKNSRCQIEMEPETSDKIWKKDAFFKVEIDREKLPPEDAEGLDLADIGRKVQKEIEKEVKTVLEERYRRILREDHPICDFILSTVKRLEDFDIVEQYEEYLEKEDRELKALKYYLFKEQR